MSKVDDINVPPETQELWDRSLVINEHFSGTRVDKKAVIYRKRNFTSLIARGQFQGLANLWNSLTELQQEDWDDAGYWAGMTGWDLFAQDTIYRINNGLLGVAVPDLYHQFFVGKIEIQDPASSIQLSQLYSGNHNIPVDFYFNAFFDMSSVGAGSYAKLTSSVYFRNWTGDFWENIIWDYEYDLTEYTEWTYFGDSFDEEDVEIIWVQFSIDIYNMRGVMYIDGIEFNYDDENHADDFQCNVFQTSWQSVDVPSGSSFQSVYPPDDF